jgi:hypothetical protein
VLETPVFVPAETDPASADRRVLGIILAEILLDGKLAALNKVIAKKDLHEGSEDDTFVWTQGTVTVTLPPEIKSLRLCVA